MGHHAALGRVEPAIHCFRKKSVDLRVKKREDFQSFC